MSYEKCLAPNCNGNVIPTVSGKIQLCPKHFEWYNFTLWMLDNVKVKPSEEKTTCE